MEIELSPDEVKAAVVAYLIHRGILVASVGDIHATGSVNLLTLTHNYDADRLTLHVVAEVTPAKPKLTRNA